MRHLFRLASALVLISGTAGFLSAEPLYKVQTDQLTGTTLFGQQLSEASLVTVKPDSEGYEGDIEAMAQCLWSVNVDFSAERTEFTPGKMICIGPESEVLEAVPVGTVEPFGACADDACSAYVVDGGQRVVMRLTAPLELSLQPRNERK